MRYSYIVKDASGKTQKGMVEAISLKHATNLLHERGLYIVSMREDVIPLLSINFHHNGISFNDVVHLTRQLSTMITAGLTLVESLSILQQQMTKASLIQLVRGMEEEVRSGTSFTQVLEKRTTIFPPVYIALVRAGEASGKLDVILSRLADTLEKNREFKSKVKGALIYPSIVVTGMVVVSIIVMTVVVPKLTSLYKEFGVSLPLPTQILINISNVIVHTWWLIAFVGVVGGVFFVRWKKTWMGQHVLATISLSLPVFGGLIKESTLVEVTRTLSILIDGGVPILSSLDIAHEATGNVLFKDAFAAASKKVEKGFPLSEPVMENKIFPPILGQMVAVGEQTGKLGESLYKLSKYFETEADTALRSLTTMIEPLIMVVLGLGVGFLVMAVLLPIYSLTNKF